MEWENYFEIYQNYERSINQSKIFTIVANEVLNDFPQNLPDDLRIPFKKRIESFQKVLEIAKSDNETKDSKTPLDIDYEDNVEKLFIHSLFMLLTFLGEKSYKDIDFERLLYSQELVMFIVHLDTFMVDTIRTICKVKPEVLKTNKQIEWDTLLNCGGWDELIEHLSEKYVFDFGYKTLAQRFEHMENKLGIKTDIKTSEIQLLSEAKLIRDVIVHNGGKISREYISKSTKKDLILGEFIELPPEYLEQVTEISRFVVSDIFITVSKKFFNVQDEKIKTRVWRRKK